MFTHNLNNLPTVPHFYIWACPLMPTIRLYVAQPATKLEAATMVQEVRRAVTAWEYTR